MFRVVSITDKKDSAIDRMARGVSRYMNGYEYIVCDVHPKRPDKRQLDDLEQAIMGADIIDFQYFRTAKMLLDKYPFLKNKKKILTHHNPYSITEDNWNEFDIVVANNETIKEDLNSITDSPVELIGNTVDTDFWTFQRDFEPRKQVIMVAGRINSKKGVLECALACQELGMKMVLVGGISDRQYFNAVMATGVVHFFENITDEKLRDLYWESMVHVCNSQDNYESGTNPILEAMLTGVPVITRNVGHVPELYSDENMVVRKGDYDDIEDLSDAILQLTSDKNRMNRMRQRAWDSAKIRSHQRRAWSYKKLYRQLMGDQVPVSVIIPIHKGHDIIVKTLAAASNQDYENLELVVCDDGNNEALIKQFQATTSRPIVYLKTGITGYGLAKARNLGVINSTGELLVFCDQRMEMQKDAVSRFAEQAVKGVWFFGNKNGKKNFVENFSCIFRDDIIRLGMFNERIDKYGGMSQELRERSRRNNVPTKYNAAAKAQPQGSSKNKFTKRQEIIEMKNMLWMMGL